MPSIKPSVQKKRKREQLKEKKRQRKLRTTPSKPPILTKGYLERHPFVRPLACILPAAHYTNGWIIDRLFSLPITKRLDLLESFNLFPDSSEQKNLFVQIRDSVFVEYVRERRIRSLFRTLFYHWRIKRLGRSTNTMDPITFCDIQTSISVYDGKQKRRFQFEATSLIKSMNKNLYASLYSIPQPKSPINVITNRPFTPYQLMSIHEQLLHTRYNIADLSMFRKLGFCIERWRLYMDSHLKIAAVRDELYTYSSCDGQRILLDYIFDTMEEIERPITDRFETILTNAVRWFPDHPFLERIRTLCMKWHTSDIFGLNIHVILLIPFNQWINRALDKNPLFDATIERMRKESDEESEIVMNQ